MSHVPRRDETNDTVHPGHAQYDALNLLKPVPRYLYYVAKPYRQLKSKQLR